MWGSTWDVEMVKNGDFGAERFELKREAQWETMASFGVGADMAGPGMGNSASVPCGYFRNASGLIARVHIWSHAWHITNASGLLEVDTQASDVDSTGSVDVGSVINRAVCEDGRPQHDMRVYGAEHPEERPQAECDEAGGAPYT